MTTFGATIPVPLAATLYTIALREHGVKFDTDGISSAGTFDLLKSGLAFVPRGRTPSFAVLNDSGRAALALVRAQLEPLRFLAGLLDEAESATDAPANAEDADES